MKKCYVPKKFTKSHLIVIDRANRLLEEYAKHGITITLRSLYYRFVANNWLKNKQQEYKRLGGILGDARLAGRIDWNHLEDRTRNLATLQHFDGPQHALDLLTQWYHVDMWANQQYRPEVWVEKDAVVGNIEKVCRENDVPYFSCRGFTSLTEMWRASMRMRQHIKGGQQPYIIHLGDHDPSGIDMSRDIWDRLTKTFMAGLEFKRLALTMDQIQEYNCPPNPAKTKDPRFMGYYAEYGDDSWELDALEPLKFYSLILTQIDSLKNQEQWDKDEEAKEAVRTRLSDIALNWEQMTKRPMTIKEADAEVKKWKLGDEGITVKKVTYNKPTTRKRKRGQ